MANSFERNIAAIGLNAFSLQELNIHYQTLYRSLEIGLNRSGTPTQEDEGLLALRTGIPLLSQSIWNQVPLGSESIIGAYGGTTWLVCHALKDEHGSVVVNKLSEQPIFTEKKPYTVENFAQFMADSICVASVQNNLTHIQIVAVSLGVPLINVQTEYGIEGIMPTIHLSKAWDSEDWYPREDKSLGKALLKRINQMGVLHIERIVFLNDTCAVALDIGSALGYAAQGSRILPVGMVCGTGTNICIGYQGELVNLEIGEAFLPYGDLVMQKMLTQDLVPPEPLLFEYYTGMFIPYRLGIAVELLGEMGAISHGQELGLAIQKSNGAFISHLAANQLQPKELYSQLGLQIEASTMSKLQTLAQLTLYKAGQVYGLMLSAIIQKLRENTDIPSLDDILLIEGSVLHKGYQVRDATERTLRQLGHQRITIINSSGLAGVATLAMSLKYIQ